MCLAEALLRIPDRGNRRPPDPRQDQQGRLARHLGESPSLFVNAAAWGLLITGKLVSTHEREHGLAAALARLIAQRRRAADPQGRGPRDAHAGPAVRHRPDDRGGARAQPRARGARLPLFLRHAGRGGADRRRRRPLLCAPTRHAIHAIGKAQRRPRHLRGARASRSSFRRCIRATRAPSASA